MEKGKNNFKVDNIYTDKLCRLIGKEKFESLLKVYNFIKKAQDEYQDRITLLPSYPIERMNNILKELRKLKKAGWLNEGDKVIQSRGTKAVREGSISKIIKLLENELLMSKAGGKLFFENPSSLFSQKKIYVIPKTYSQEFIAGCKVEDIEKWDLEAIQYMPKKRGRKITNDAMRILLFCLYALLKKAKCSDIYRTLGNCIEECKIPCPGNTLETLRSALRNLKRADIKSVYKKHYDNSVVAQKGRHGVIISHELPSWENIFE